MTGNNLVFGASTVVKKDAVYEYLLQPWEHDDKVLVYLEVILPAIGELARKIFRDHLPGGKWENVTEEMRRKSQGTSKHNKFAESVFGYLDQLLRKNPNISVLASESYVMFTLNKTKACLGAKTEEEKCRLVQQAMRNVPDVRRAFQTRKSEIQRKQIDMLKDKMRKAEEAEVQRLAKLQVYTYKIVFYGL